MKKRNGFVFLMVSLLFASSLACGLTAGKATAVPTLIAATVPPAATFTLQPTDTDTPVPPTVTSLPTSTAIPGSKEPFTVNNIQLQIDLVEFGQPYKGMFAPAEMTDSQTVLTVEVNVPAGSTTDEVSNFGPWVTDDNNVRSELGTGLSHEEPKPQVVWLFAVSKTAKSFILHFPGGENVDLAPLLP